ncbi:MAG: hypothetical protein GX321_01670 [Clostridiales bacterium]|nr:hypothetical protein [Clostridiales bacterium]
MDKLDYESELEEHLGTADLTSGLVKGKVKKILMLSGGIILVLTLLFMWVIFTKSGRSLIYKIAGKAIYTGLDTDDDMESSSVITPLNKQDNYKDNITDDSNKANNKTTNKASNNKEDKDTSNLVIPRKKTEPRCEDYVSNYLILGIEEIKNAKNTDTMMIASINTKDNSIKLTSLLRDTYIESDNCNPNKLNAFYSLGGAGGLVELIEEKYRIDIDGYASINFESFEKIIDYLGGISIELGVAEAEYLNTTNYISNPKYRNVKPGWNLLNGNQALGYCRIRMVETLGGATDDYGRTLRQRRVLSAIFNKYKSKNIFSLISISKNVLGYVKTNVTQSQIEKALEDIVENKISKMDTMRVPCNGLYEAPLEYNGITYPLVLDWDANVMELYKFIYLDNHEQAKANLEKYR